MTVADVARSRRSSSARTSCTSDWASAGWPRCTAPSSAASRASSGSSRSSACCRTSPRTRPSSSRSSARPSSPRCSTTHNIVQLYELGRVGTEYFISMEYIDGRDIRRILRHARKVSGAADDQRHRRHAVAALPRRSTTPTPSPTTTGRAARPRPPRRLAVEPDRHPLGPPQGHRLRHRASAQSAQLRTQTGRVKGKLAYLAPEAISRARTSTPAATCSRSASSPTSCSPRGRCSRRRTSTRRCSTSRSGDVPPPSAFNQALPPRRSTRW
jgi:hypothetical protein